MNRIIKDFKGSDDTKVQWARDLKKLLQSLEQYVSEYVPTGITWNPKGVNADAAPPAAAGPPPPPPAGGAPPPPPPGPPPPPVDAGAAPSGDDDAATRSKLFSDLNKGADITKGLKKVTDDMKTHKNPAIRQGPKPFAKPAVAPKFKAFNTPAASSAPAQQAKKPPVLELQGKKWLVEHQENNKAIVLDDVNMKQTVYVYKCVNSTIQVKGKVNSITLDNCKKPALVFENCIASADFINCQSVQCQVTGKVPSVSIDKTDGFQMYLSSESMDTVITSAKSSEMNILIPQADGDFKEFAVPEQFRTVWKDNKLATTINESI